MATCGVANLQEENCEFAVFVDICFNRYIHGDWGDVCFEDWQSNDMAVKCGERIHASYNDADHPEWRIWIITEWDRSVTTILFPDEY